MYNMYIACVRASKRDADVIRFFYYYYYYRRRSVSFAAAAFIAVRGLGRRA